MANTEWDSKMNELHDSQLGSQKPLERLEGTVKDNNEQLRVLTSVVLQHENQVADLRLRHENDVAELRAMMTSLIANIDRFIQGWQSNGH